MDKQRIWAPWRLDYVANQAVEASPRAEPTEWQPGADHDCFLCRAAATFDAPEEANRENLVVWLRPQTVTLLNRYPYTNGHLLVSPLRHVGLLDQLTDAEHLDAMQSLSALTHKLGTLIDAEGFNVGLNLGTVAGAGVPGHLHWHLVPRWTGDNNFMPTIAQTRVIPQSLAAMWEALATVLVE